MYDLVFSSRAEAEFIEAFYWYEERTPGVGRRFEQIVDQQLQLLKENPFVFQEINRTYRECVLPVFPFVIIYKCYLERNEILILSIFHTAQNPKDKFTEKK